MTRMISSQSLSIEWICPLENGRQKNRFLVFVFRLFTYIKSNRLRCGIGERLGLAEWHLILSDRKCWWFTRKFSSNSLGGHGQKFFEQIEFDIRYFKFLVLLVSGWRLVVMAFDLPANWLEMHLWNTMTMMDLVI